MGSILTPNPPRKIDLKGSPREIGLSHGRLLRDEILSQISIYRSMFLVTSNLTWPAVLQVAADFQATIRSLTPDIYAEIKGIAEGADVNVLDIVALNCRSEIALGKFSDGCTSLAWTANERTILAQNWDWVKVVKGNLVMMRIEQPGKPKIWMVTEAGIVGKIGFNSAGVGTCLNAIRARPMHTDKIPVHVALRLCLEAESVDSAIKTLERLGGVASAQHILIADSKSAVGMEVSPLGAVHLKPDTNGIVAHSNHFIVNKLVDEPPWLPGSPVRLQRAKILSAELLAEGYKINSISGQLLRNRIFGDTFNTPESICCSENPKRPVETRSSTLFNIVMNLKEGGPSAEVVWGKPGSGEEGEVLTMPW